jgi:GDP-L-fucose synthase
MTLSGKIYVAGHRGLVGSAIARALARRGVNDVLVRTHAELDLCDQRAVREFFRSEKPDKVILAAAKVGGIHANNAYPADFIRDNLLVQTNVIDAAYQNGANKFLFLGSSCIYPKFAPQPMREECLLSGPLEPTNEWYAVAKIAGIKTCQAYRRQYGFEAISLMPTNLYGQNDNFDDQNAHVIPSLMRRFHEAKMRGDETVEVWGSGQAKREFLHADDLAEAALLCLEKYDEEQIINVGSGRDLRIAELAGLVRDAVGFSGELRFDASKPDGTPRKLLDVSRITALCWTPKITLKEGLASTYAWFLENIGGIRQR